jgi:hypothetical protein
MRKAKRQEAEFSVLIARIFYSQRVDIFDHRCCICKIQAMVAQIALALGFIPRVDGHFSVAA